MPRAAAVSTRRPPSKTTTKRRTATAVKPTVSATPPVVYSKEDLLRRFAPLVRHVVERVAATLPRNVDHEDLYSAGVLGLLDAHAKFDLRKGVKFETYAVWRIKGAVLDQLRALDWASRSMRRKARRARRRHPASDQKLGRAATDHELARAMKMSYGDFYSVARSGAGAVLVSLDESRSGEDQEPARWATTLADPSAVNLEEKLAEERASCCSSARSISCPSRSGWSWRSTTTST
jgi:RNA polymerase sigma factor (sigma-70 family)